MWAKSLLLSALLAAAAVTGPVSAQQRGPAFEAQTLIPAQERGNRGQDIRPLREVVSILRGRYGGELISAQLEDGPRPVYLIRWRMPDGEVRDLRVDAVR
jgi:uncharacterized membrane protein YkoI